MSKTFCDDGQLHFLSQENMKALGIWQDFFLCRIRKLGWRELELVRSGSVAWRLVVGKAADGLSSCFPQTFFSRPDVMAREERHRDKLIPLN